MFEEAIRYAVYSALIGDSALNGLVEGVYDYVAQPADAGQDSDFPYVVIGDNTYVPWDTDTETGADATITIHTWSRYKGRREVADIQDAIYRALHRQDIPVDGAATVGCELENSELLPMDGNTSHGVQRYRLIVDGGKEVL